MEQMLYHCAAYYPELWDESKIDSDIDHMKKLGINCVRIGEFAWHTMEPEPDQIDMSFFVRVVDKLYANGIYTMMCTPTPTPPIWVTHGHPERLVVDYDGKRYIHGARLHVCDNNPYMRERTAIIVEAMAKAFSGHEGVIAWQLDNEMKSGVPECLCECCAQQWHAWLKAKYGTIEALNQAWGTALWSEHYNAFEQVVQPFNTLLPHNASLLTDYRRFARETTNDYAFMQADILRKYDSAPITHDVHTFFALDMEGLFAGLDFTSMNGYTGDDGYSKWQFDYDYFRGMRQDKRFFVTETSPNYSGNTVGVGRHHRPGFLEIEALGAYASGAFGFSYWLFQQQRSGCEITHGALLSAWNTPSTGYAEAQKVTRLLSKVEDGYMQTTHKRPEIALIYSSEAKSYFFSESILEGGNYFDRMLWVHERMEAAGLHKDVIPTQGDLAFYKLVFTPFLPYVSPEFEQKAMEFVRNGGIWIIGPMTGYRTQYHTVPTDHCLGNLEACAGVTAEFFYPMSATDAQLKAFGLCAPACLHGAALTVQAGTSVKGSMQGGITDGYAFLTERKVGKGMVVVLSALPQIGTPEGDKLMETILEHYTSVAEVTDRFSASNGTTVITREGTGAYKRIYTAINGTDVQGEYTLCEDGVDIITGNTVLKGARPLLPFGYEVIAVK